MSLPTLGLRQLNRAFLMPANLPSRPFCALLNQTRSLMFQNAAIPGNGIPFLDFQKTGGASPPLSGRFGNRVVVRVRDCRRPRPLRRVVGRARAAVLQSSSFVGERERESETELQSATIAPRMRKLHLTKLAVAGSSTFNIGGAVVGRRTSSKATR